MIQTDIEHHWGLYAEAFMILYGSFLSHRGTPLSLAGWFWSKSQSKMDDVSWGTPSCQDTEPSICDYHDTTRRMRPGARLSPPPPRRSDVQSFRLGTKPSKPKAMAP